MKQRITFLIAALLLEIFSIRIVNSQTGTPGSHNIPVYPGASLLTKNTPAEESYCCDFVTKDAMDKVIAFYEAALKTKALDATALGAKYQDMKPQIDMMISHMPPQMKMRFFVLQEIVFQGKKEAELFVMGSDPSGVHFSITESQFLTKDAHFVADWQEAMAKSSGTAEPKAIDPSQLEAALPSTPPAGFKKHEVGSEKNNGISMTSGPPISERPSICVAYSKLFKKAVEYADGGAPDEYYMISIYITDESGDEAYTSGGSSWIKAKGPGEKDVKVKGKYDGNESVEKNDSGCVGADKKFIVNNRYLIEIRTDHICDMAVLNQVIDSMHLENLPK